MDNAIPMRSLIIDDKQYEIVDYLARDDISEIKGTVNSIFSIISDGEAATPTHSYSGEYAYISGEGELHTKAGYDGSSVTIPLSACGEILTVGFDPNATYPSNAGYVCIFSTSDALGSSAPNYYSKSHFINGHSTMAERGIDNTHVSSGFFTIEIAKLKTALPAINAITINFPTGSYLLNKSYRSRILLPSLVETVTNILNSRHVRNNEVAPLTLLHLSDVHSDSAALERIWSQCSTFGDVIDDAICTGDMVANSGGAISSWWNPEIMTCVGNHDAATYSSGSYNWTGVSMADRAAYYIAPFKSNWNVVHTTGTSYYYKDYTAQKVRLIVMDGMLYMGTPGSEATTQTAWLYNLLSSAITNDLHVVIAIHGPHGGATVKACTFSQMGTYSVAPTYGDCNTPQIIIDTVAERITSGLKFIGYLVGHEHKDFIYDAENDGTQLMYCVTCANVKNEAQWVRSDMHRDTSHDAYNVVTIDTANTLIKIVRGGGANSDDRGRPRKYICINYSTGQIVGESTT